MTLVTLLYIRNSKGEYLLLERKKDPNKGLLSPPGGKLEADLAELPVDCARREAFEECGISTQRSDWTLRGIASEKDYPKAGNLLLFFYELNYSLDQLPPEIREGKFRFVSKDEILNSVIPETDKKFFWHLMLNEQNSFFEISLDCSKNIEEIPEKVF